MQFILRFSAALLTVILADAETGCHRSAELPQYKMAFVNATSGHISDARADWVVGGVASEAEAGQENPGVSKVELLRPQSVPRKTTVSWRTADGVGHRQEVEVERLVPDPSRFGGTIFFKITENGKVTVVPLTDDQMLNLSMQHKDYP